MKINKVRLVNSNLSVAIDYTDESGQEHLLILGAENVVKNWQAVEHSVEPTLPDRKGSAREHIRDIVESAREK